MTSPATVVVADDDPIVRRGVAAVLERDALSVVGEAADVRSLVARVRAHAPDLVVTAAQLGGTPVWPTIASLTARTAVVAVLAVPTVAELTAAVDAGVRGLVAAPTAVADLPTVCRATLRAEYAASPGLADTAVAALARARGLDAPTGECPLTTRELEVLRHVALGLRTREIAAALGLADNTVKNHMRAVRAKLRVTTSVGAVLTAIERGFLAAP